MHLSPLALLPYVLLDSWLITLFRRLKSNRNNRRATLMEVAAIGSITSLVTLLVAGGLITLLTQLFIFKQ